MNHERFVGEIERHAAAFLDAAERTEATTAVPTCGDWTMTDLLGHVGPLHRWVVELCAQSPSEKAAARPAPPDGYAERIEWAREGAGMLVQALRRYGPDHECKAFRGVEQSAGFWARRQAHEIAVHRLDAELAAGAEVDALYPPELAADGVDELLVLMLPRAVAGRGPVTARGTALFEPSDVDRSWSVRLEPGQPLEVTAGREAADVRMRGTADAVFRAVWGRPSSVEVTGERGLLDQLRSP